MDMTRIGIRSVYRSGNVVQYLSSHVSHLIGGAAQTERKAGRSGLPVSGKEFREPILMITRHLITASPPLQAGKTAFRRSVCQNILVILDRGIPQLLPLKFTKSSEEVGVYS